MQKRIIDEEMIQKYREYLFADEKSKATIEKYLPVCTGCGKT